MWHQRELWSHTDLDPDAASHTGLGQTTQSPPPSFSLSINTESKTSTAQRWLRMKRSRVPGTQQALDTAQHALNARACEAHRDFLPPSPTSQALHDCFRVVRACTRAHTCAWWRWRGGAELQFPFGLQAGPRGGERDVEGPVREVHRAAFPPPEDSDPAGPLEFRGGTAPRRSPLLQDSSSPSADSVSRADL